MELSSILVLHLVHLVGFIIKKYVTMHGHMNVKKMHFIRFTLHDRRMFMTSVRCLKTFHYDISTQSQQTESFLNVIL